MLGTENIMLLVGFVAPVFESAAVFVSGQQ